MATPTTTLSAGNSPLLSTNLTSPFTLRSGGQTLPTSLYDGLFDGSYKACPIPFISSSLYSNSASPEKLNSKDIIYEFEKTNIFADSKIDRLRARAVKLYNRALLRKKSIEKQGLKHGFDGRVIAEEEYLFTRLQICELELARIALTRDLKNHYGKIIDCTKTYEDPYNLPSEKSLAEGDLMRSYIDYVDCLKIISYLTDEMTKLHTDLCRQAAEGSSVKSWIRKRLRP